MRSLFVALTVLIFGGALFSHALGGEDFERGKALFTGKVKFKNGAVACIACHDIKGVFPLGGGNLGPDLSGVYENLGEEGLMDAFSDIPFPTMEPIYKDNPLTKDEIHYLSEFFKGVSGNRTRGNPIVYSLLAFLVVFFLPLLVWRKRLVPSKREFSRKGR